MNNRRKLQLLVLGVGFLSLVAVIFSIILSVPLLTQVLKPVPAPVPTTSVPAPTPMTPGLGPVSASISGRVWHDLCAVGGGGEGDLVPSAGCVPASGGGYQANGVMESGEPGLGGVLAQLGAGACPAFGLATVTTAMDGGYTFGGLSADTYCVSVDASRVENALMLPGGWTFPAMEAGSNIASHTVSVSEGEHRSGMNFGWDYESLPKLEVVPTQLPQPSPSQTPLASPSAACTNQAALVRDVTIPDYTRLLPDQSFVKTWRLRNSGTCAWTQDYALVFAGGDSLGGPASVPLAGPVKPGETVDLSVTLVAPAGNGTYQGKWQLRTADGVLFGLGRNASDPFWVRIVVGPTPTASPVPPAVANWRGEYYDNRDLRGTPVLVQNEAEINFNWGSGAPAAGLPDDGFSARWSRTLSFQAGTYRFYAFSDDGVRVWLDGELIIDQWRDAADVTHTAERTLMAASHALRVEYYENFGMANMRFWWERLEFSDWRGEYWSNPSLSGNPVVVRNDVAIDFFWGSDAPETKLPADNFSARWSRRMTFEPGLYRFSVRADDGVRFFLDGNLVLNEWHDSDGKKTYTVDVPLGGSHQLVVEYYEGGWDAWIDFWWERIG